jgi:hypothetical protein
VAKYNWKAATTAAENATTARTQLAIAVNVVGANPHADTDGDADGNGDGDADADADADGNADCCPQSCPVANSVMNAIYVINGFFFIGVIFIRGALAST